MKIIDSAFIDEWHPKYDLLENDENVYKALVTILSQKPNLTKALLLRIFDWKARRAKGHIDLTKFCSYQAVFNFCINNPLKALENLQKLDGLPGIGLPIATTILHLMFPNVYPIIDIRTVTVLYKAAKINFCSDSAPQSHTKYLNLFCPAILDIHEQTERTLRQIDRALFAYHKIVIDKHRPKDACKTGYISNLLATPKNFGSTHPQNGAKIPHKTRRTQFSSIPHVNKRSNIKK